MTAEERDAFLSAERMCRVASTGPEGPHVTPLWFAWTGTHLWLTSVVQSQRFSDLRRDGRVSVVVDTGHDFMELRGVEIRGTAAVVGEVPRTGEAVAELEEPERIFATKYADGRMRHDGRHAWLRITPHKLVSWDFRKIGR